MFKKIITLSLLLSTSVFATERLEVGNINMDIRSFYGINPQGADVSRFFSNFPFEYSIKTKYGRGKHLFVEFVDVNCPYCRKQAIDFKSNENSVNGTSYQFLVQVNPDPEKIAEHIWCTKDKSKALYSWYELLTKEPKPTKEIVNTWKAKYPSKECKTPIEYNTRFMKEFLSEQMGEQAGISTPTTIFSNGLKGVGNLSPVELNKIYEYIEKNPLEIPNYEELNSFETSNKMRFFKEVFMKEKTESKQENK